MLYNLLAHMLAGMLLFAAVPDGAAKKDEDVQFLSRESKGTINSYAVSERGEIAVSFGDHNINVYDSDLEFLYGIDFDPNHAVQQLFWDGDALIVCRKSSVRFDDIIVSGEDDAAVYEMPDTEKSEQLWEKACRNQSILIETADYDYQYTDGSLLRTDRKTGENEVITADDKWEKLSWNFSGILFFGSFAGISSMSRCGKRNAHQKRRKNRNTSRMLKICRKTLDNSGEVWYNNSVRSILAGSSGKNSSMLVWLSR